jgi:hypothetical protein
MLKRILGAYWYDERVVFIDTEQADERVLFTDAHEATHAMCRWHEDVLRLDTEDELFKQLHPGVEAEANFGAGHLIFQGGRFHRVAFEDQVSMRTPLELASRYGASRHAAVHYYVQEHPNAVALLVAGRYPYCDGTLPVWRSVESPDFLRRFGRLRHLLPDGKLSIRDDTGAPLAEIVNAAQSATDPPSKRITIPEIDGTRTKFVAEAFFNGYSNLIFVAEAKSRRLGRRVRFASSYRRRRPRRCGGARFARGAGTRGALRLCEIPSRSRGALSADTRRPQPRSWSPPGARSSDRRRRFALDSRTAPMTPPRGVCAPPERRGAGSGAPARRQEGPRSTAL